MNFELTELQQLVQDTARRFALEEIAPTLEEEERNHEFRQDRVAKMGELGFLSCVLPEELRPALSLLLRAALQNPGPHVGPFQLPFDPAAPPRAWPGMEGEE